LDGDGRLDVLSGSWPGELYWFRRLPDGTFEKKVLKNKEGENIYAGMESMEMVLEDVEELLREVDAEAEEENEGVETQQEQQQTEQAEPNEDEPQKEQQADRAEQAEEDESSLTPVGASTVFAADWDRDGDLDLLLGNIRGDVYLVKNEGSRRQLAFGREVPLECESGPIKFEQGDSAPIAADWDLDGDLDLIVGTGEGDVWLYLNVGSATAPKLAAGIKLVAAPETTFVEGKPLDRPGARTKPCVADWNGDGLADLLVGDVQWVTRAEQPDREAGEKTDKDVQQRLQRIMTEYKKLGEKLFGPNATTDPDELEAIREKMQELMEAYEELSPSWSMFGSDIEVHGYVWFFARKAIKRAPAK